MSSKSISDSQSSAHVEHSPVVPHSSQSGAPHMSQYTMWSSRISFPRFEHLMKFSSFRMSYHQNIPNASSFTLFDPSRPKSSDDSFVKVQLPSQLSVPMFLLIHNPKCHIYHTWGPIPSCYSRLFLCNFSHLEYMLRTLIIKDLCFGAHILRYLYVFDS